MMIRGEPAIDELHAPTIPVVDEEDVGAEVGDPRPLSPSKVDKVEVEEDRSKLPVHHATFVVVPLHLDAEDPVAHQAKEESHHHEHEDFDEANASHWN